MITLFTHAGRKGLCVARQLPDKPAQEKRGQWAAQKENIRYNLHPVP